MKTLTEEWNNAHQNRRIVVKARNVLCSFVEIERERERPITCCIFYHLNKLSTSLKKSKRYKEIRLTDNGILMRG